MGRSNHGLGKVHIYESVAVEGAGTGTMFFFHPSQSALSYVKRRAHTGPKPLSREQHGHLGCTRKVPRGSISQYEQTNFL